MLYNLLSSAYAHLSDKFPVNIIILGLFPFLGYFCVPSFEMFAENDCVGMEPLERCILKHPFGSWHLICSLLPRRWQAVHRRSSTRLLHDPNPPTYCSNRVPRQTKSCFILFINREEGGPGQRRGARMGRVVASKCDPYYVWHTHISTIQECMQTANPQAKCELLVPGN